jgi:hypothetical protein
MADLTHEQYDALERAVTNSTRIAVYRRGTEYVLIPTRLELIGGREAVEARHPTTGDRMTLYIDEVDSIDVLR